MTPKLFIIIFSFLILNSATTSSRAGDGLTPKLEKMLCNKLGNDRSFKSLKGYAEKKGGSIEVFLLDANCRNKSGIDQQLGMATIKPATMIIFRPMERIILLNDMLIHFHKNNDMATLHKILNYRDLLDRTLLDFLEEQLNKMSHLGILAEMYNTMRARICKYGGYHAKNVNKGKCTKDFLAAQKYRD